MKQNVLFKTKPQIAPDYLGYLELCEAHEYEVDPQILSSFRTLGLKLMLTTFVRNPLDISEEVYHKFIKFQDKLPYYYQAYCSKFMANAYSAYLEYLKGKTYDEIGEDIGKSKTQVGRYIKKCKDKLSSTSFKEGILSRIDEIESDAKVVVKASNVVCANRTPIAKVNQLDMNEFLQVQASLPVLSTEVCDNIIKTCRLEITEPSHNSQVQEMLGRLFCFHPNPDTAFNARLCYDGRSNDEIIKIRKSLGLQVKENFNYKVNSKKTFYTYIRNHQESIVESLSSVYSKLFDIDKSNLFETREQYKFECNVYRKAYEILEKAGIVNELYL